MALPHNISEDLIVNRTHIVENFEYLNAQAEAGPDAEAVQDIVEGMTTDSGTIETVLDVLEVRDSSITISHLANISGLSVLGNHGANEGPVETIFAAPDGKTVLTEFGDSLAFRKLSEGYFDAANLDGATGIPSLRTLGAGAQQAVPGNDSRLSNARTPTDNSVSTAKVQDGAITNPKIASGIDAVKLAAGTVSNTVFGYLAGVTSSIQTQLDARVAKSTLTTKGDIFAATGAGVVARLGVGTNGFAIVADSSTSTGLKYYDFDDRYYTVGEIDALLAVEAVQSASGLMVNGWTSVGVGYYKDRGRVYLQGQAVAGSGSSGLTIFPLPAGYRPSANRTFTAYCSNLTPCVGYVGTSGEVVVQTTVAAGQNVGLDAVMFRL